MDAFIVAAGIQIGNTVTSSYIVDSYPLQSTSVITLYAVFLNLSAFINPVFFHPPLASASVIEQSTNWYTIVLHFLMAGFVRLDLGIYRRSTYRARWRYVRLCLVAEIRGVDAGFSAGAVVG